MAVVVVDLYRCVSKYPSSSLSLSLTTYLSDRQLGLSPAVCSVIGIKNTHTIDWTLISPTDCLTNRLRFVSYTNPATHKKYLRSPKGSQTNRTDSEYVIWSDTSCFDT